MPFDQMEATPVGKYLNLVVFANEQKVTDGEQTVGDRMIRTRSVAQTNEMLTTSRSEW